MNDDDATVGYCNSSSSSNRAELHCTCTRTLLQLCAATIPQTYFSGHLLRPPGQWHLLPCPSWLAGWLAGIYFFIFGFLLVTDWDRCPCRTWCFGKILFSTAVITGPGERAAPGA
jgi:hypothetical protein